MTSVLKGNFKPQKEISAEKKEAETLEQKFEAEALKRLGGSIAFVKRRKVAWDIKD
jgi:hypothetical protein